MAVPETQLITYIKLAITRLDYPINFNVSVIKQGIRPKQNGYL